MTGRRRLGVVAAGATLLAAFPLTTIFETWTWLMQSLLVVGLIAGAAALARTLRFPTWAQALGMVVALLLTLTWLFPSGKELLIPQGATFTHFADLINQAGADSRSYGVPVPDRPGLLFVAVLGVGAVAIVVDLLTAVFRKPALAGLPMLAIYSIPVAIYLDNVPVLPFVVGASGYLWLLVADNVDRVRRFGRRFTGDGRNVDVWEPSPLASAGRRLGMIGLAAAVFVPLLVPTVSGGLLSQLTQGSASVGGGRSGTGNGGKINLFAALSGQLSQTETVTLVKVSTNEPDPFYLRFGVAEVLTTEGFSNRQPNGGVSVSDGLPDPRSATGTSRVPYQAYRAQVEITDRLTQTLAPVYTVPTRVDGIGNSWSYDQNQQVVYSRRNTNTTKGRKYSVDYLRARYNPADLRTAPPLAPDHPIRKQYVAVPQDDFVNERVATLVRGKTTDYDKVRAIYDSFSSKNGFIYQLSTETPTNSSEIAAFLKNKAGYCQQYAAAMAWMVRAAGIPARVAFGFTRGDRREGDKYVITNRNAHAWTEVYLDGFGWVPFDATPAASVPGSSRPEWAPDLDRPVPTASASTDAAAPGADPSTGPDDIANQHRTDSGALPGADLDTPAEETSPVNLWIAAGVALFLALLLAPAMRRVLLRRQRHARTTARAPAVLAASGPGGPDGLSDIEVTSDTIQDRADAHSAWDELIDTMVDFRVPVNASETPRATAHRLIQDTSLTGDSATAATLLGSAEERARYARQPLRGVELTTALKQIRAGLKQSVGFRVRLRALLLPPSVLLSWRVALSQWSTNVAAAMSRARDVLIRFSPRRLLANRAR